MRFVLNYMRIHYTLLLNGNCLPLLAVLTNFLSQSIQYWNCLRNKICLENNWDCSNKLVEGQSRQWRLREIGHRFLLRSIFFVAFLIILFRRICRICRSTWSSSVWWPLGSEFNEILYFLPSDFDAHNQILDHILAMERAGFHGTVNKTNSLKSFSALLSFSILLIKNYFIFLAIHDCFRHEYVYIRRPTAVCCLESYEKFNLCYRWTKDNVDCVAGNKLNTYNRHLCVCYGSWN